MLRKEAETGKGSLKSSACQIILIQWVGNAGNRENGERSKTLSLYLCVHSPNVFLCISLNEDIYLCKVANPPKIINNLTVI